MIRKIDLAAALLAGFTLSACSGGSLTTSSIFGGSSSPPPTKASANDTTSRTLQVATTSARALKCGYNFDPARLKANFLATEATTGVADMAKLEQAYDMTFRRISASITKSEEFCTADMTRELKSDLSRHLAGDYTPRGRHESETTVASSPKVEPMDRERIFDPGGVRTPK